MKRSGRVCFSSQLTWANVSASQEKPNNKNDNDNDSKETHRNASEFSGSRCGGSLVDVLSAQRLPSSVSLAENNFTASLGFFIPPPAALSAGSYFSDDLNAIGDISNDGFTDFAIAAYQATVNGVSEAGEVFVIFGSDHIFTRFFLKNNNAKHSFLFPTLSQNNFSLTSHNDENSGFPSLSTLDGTNGFVIQGTTASMFL